MISLEVTVSPGPPNTADASVETVSCTVCGTEFSARTIDAATRRTVIHLIDHRPQQAQR